jgi:sec-independent protein translocase protein TatA
MNLNVLLFGLGPMEIVLIVAVVLLLFGGRKIPELMKGLGQGMREFRKASHVDDDQDQELKKKDNK